MLSGLKGSFLSVLYSANCTASFNPSELVLIRSGDIHPLPGPETLENSAKINISSKLKSKAKVAHLNVRSMKSREQFCLVKDTILLNDFDIFTISETWLDSTVDNASIEISGYQLFRQDRGPYKSGGGLCVYTKSSLKAIVLEDLSLVSDDGLQQLWLSVQCRKQKSFLICNVYRPPGTPINCFDTLADHFINSLSLGFDIIILGDLNCNVLRSCPEATALLDFISSFNLSQLVDKPTRITETSQSIIDVIMTTNKSMIGLCDVLTCSISDHNLIYIVLTLKTPRNKSKYKKVGILPIRIV